MISRTLMGAGLLAGLLIGGGVSAQDGVLLRYKFVPENEVKYRTTTEMKQTMRIAGQSFENSVTQTEENALSLVEMTGDRNLKLRYANERLAVKADLGPAGTFQFDSESPEREKGTTLSNDLNPVFETLSGVEYQIVITPQGQVETLEGYQEIVENLVKDNPLAAQFTGGGSEKAQKASLAETFFQMKDEPVQQGDSWEVPYELELPKLGTAKGKRVYRYEGPVKAGEPNLVKISMTLEASFDFDLTTEGANVTGNIATDSSKGDIRFDVEKGQVVSASLEYALSGTITTVAGERTIKVTTKQQQTRNTQRLTDGAK